MAAWFGGLRLPAAPLVIAAVVLAVAAAAVRAWPLDPPGAARRGVRWVLAARGAALVLCAAGALGAAGGAVAAWRIQARAAPRLAAPTGPLAVTGWVEAVQPGARGPRFVVRVTEIEGGLALKRVQISASDGPGPGRAVRCVAVLRPPAPPLAPQAFDPQFRAYVGQVGAVGFALGRCRPATAPAPTRVVDRWALRVAAMRRDLADAVAEAAPGRGGGIAAALIAGDSSFVDADSTTALRDSGLAHLLSVSGLHMSLVAGMTFAAVTMLVACAPPVALRVPARKVGAAAALIAGAGYLVISGASVPAERAFVMTAVAFGAVLLDRPAITMRGLAFAAMVVLARRPESVLDPGFQMSFAATGALVAWFEAARRRPPQPASALMAVRVFDAVRGFVAADLVTALVAGSATDPFVLFHFGRFTTYAALANLAAGPIVAFVVAPAAGVAAVAAPFGLAEAPLKVMAAGLDLVVAIGAGFAARPEAVVPVAPLPPAAFGCAVLALMWAIVARGGMRFAALAPTAAAVLIATTAPRPVMLVRDDARMVFARVADRAGDAGEWRTLTPARGGDFARDRLAALAGLDPRRAPNLVAPEGCARDVACTWRTPNGAKIAWAPTEAARVAACATADLVISPAPAKAKRAKVSGVGLTTADPAGLPAHAALTCKARQIAPAQDGRGGYAVFDDATLTIRRGRAARDADAPWARPGDARPTDSGG